MTTETANRNIQVISVGKRFATLYYVHGKVMSAGKYMENNVSGSGGGGYSHQGTGTTDPIHISSTTTVHDKIFLVTKEGNEVAFSLQDFDLSVRDGHLVTVVAINEGAEVDPEKARNLDVVAVLNHSLSTEYVKRSVVHDVTSGCMLPFAIDRSTTTGKIKMFALLGAVLGSAAITAGAGLLLIPYFEYLVVRPKMKELATQIISRTPAPEPW